MSRSLHTQPGRLGWVCPYVAGQGPRYRWWAIVPPCRVPLAAHPGGWCSDRPTGVTCRQVRNPDGLVASRAAGQFRVTRGRGYRALVNQIERRERGRVGRELRDAARLFNAGQDIEGFDVAPTRHRHSAMWWWM